MLAKEGLVLDMARAPKADGVLEVMVGGEYPGVLSIVSEIGAMSPSTLYSLLSKMCEMEPSASVIADATQTNFSVHHTGGTVQYDSTMVLSACGSKLTEAILGACHSSGNSLLRSCSTHIANQEGLTSFGQFKGKAEELLGAVNTDSTNVVHCLLPSKSGKGMVQGEMVQQLEDSIVPQLINWHKNGFTEYIPHGQFVRDYRYLLSDEDLQRLPLTECCKKILQSTLPPDAYAIGLYNVLLKGSKTKSLAAHLTARRAAAAVQMQALALMHHGHGHPYHAS